MSKGIGGIDWDAIQDALAAWVAAGTGVTATHILWEGQKRAGRPPEPGISLSLTGIQFVGWDWLDTRTKVLSVGTLAVTLVDPVADALTIPAHGLVTADGPIRIGAGVAWPAGLAEATDYWVIVLDANRVRLCRTFQRAKAGSYVDIGDVGVGAITLSGTPETVRAGHEIEFAARGLRKAVLVVQAYAADGMGLAMPQAALASLVSRCELPSMRDMLDPVGVAVTDFGRIRAHHGSYNLAYFEPRAVLEVELNFVSEVVEDGTVIERVVLTDQVNGDVEVIPPDQ